MDKSSVHKLDAHELKKYLVPVIHEKLEADIEIHQFKSGQSNPTYYVKLGNAEVVLRKKPPGNLLKGAHQTDIVATTSGSFTDCRVDLTLSSHNISTDRARELFKPYKDAESLLVIDREYRVMLALGRANFPVPRMIGYCKDASVIGSEFYVMQYLKGRVLDFSMAGLSSNQRRDCMFHAVKTLSRLHGFTPSALGLDGFGKSNDYCGRVLRTWTRQYRASANKDIPNMSKLISWLQQQLGFIKEQTCIIHGDYSVNNIMFHPSKSEVLAVLDWELSTIGHPLMDFSYFCLLYHVPPEFFVVRQVTKEQVEQLLADLPKEEELVRYYCQLTGTTYPIPHWNFYLALNFFKLASITQGVYSRSLKGNASSPYAEIFGAVVEPLIDAGLKISKRLVLSVTNATSIRISSVTFH